MKFVIHIFKDFVRVTYSGILSKVRAEFDGSCIFDIDVLTYELHRIQKYCKENYDKEPIFEILNNYAE